MKRDNVNYLVAGSVVVGTLLFLFFILYNITGQRSGDVDRYVAYYDEVAGLKYGTPVYFEGYSIGQIETVEPEHEGTQTRFKVELAITQGWPLSVDTVAAIATAGLLSDTFLVLQQGDSNTVLKPGSELAARGASDIFGSLGDLADNVNDLTEQKIKPLIDTISERIDSITLNIEGSTPLVIEDIRTLLERLDGAAQGIQQIMRPGNITRIDNIMVNAEQATADIAAMTSELDQIRRQVSTLTAEMNGMLSETKGTLSDTMIRMRASINDFAVRLESIGHNIDEASRNFNEFTRGIRKDPSTLIFSPDADKTGENP